MDSTEIKEPEHTYKCVECGLVFDSETHAEKCPRCSCRVLIHVKGEKRGAACASCSGGNCSCCGGCSH